MFVDYNGDGQTDGNDQVAMEKTQYPWRTYNLHLGFTYKNIGFSALLYGVTDVGYAFPERLYWDFRGGHVSAFHDVVDRWRRATLGKEIGIAGGWERGCQYG